jgi:cell division septation protein DedD
LPDFDITADNETMGTDDDSPIPEDEFADAFGDTSFLDKAETEPPTQQESSENKTAATDTVAMENIVNVRLSPFEFEQEEIKKQLEVTEKKLKKAKIFSYVALGFGAVALTAAIGLGVMTYKAKTEVSSLTGVVTNLEQSLKNSAEGNSKEAINTMLNSVVQLNQQIYDFINDLKGNPQLPADALNNKVPGIAEKQVMVSNALKTLRGKIGDLDEATLSELSIVESPKEPTKIEIQPTPAKESHNTLMPPVKTEAVIEPIASPKTVVPEPPPIAAKEAPKVEVAAKVKIKAEVVKPKPVISAKTADRELSKPSAGGNWGVNLVAFKQEWFAQSKAAEFARQGVYADVIPIQGDGGTMYRLRVGGFASKKEANASKDKIRRVLNLDSVWVSDN